MDEIPNVYQKMWPHLVIFGARKLSMQIGHVMGLSSSYQSSTCSTDVPVDHHEAQHVRVSSCRRTAGYDHKRGKHTFRERLEVAERDGSTILELRDDEAEAANTHREMLARHLNSTWQVGDALGVQELALCARLHVRLLLAGKRRLLTLGKREIEQVVGTHAVARRAGVKVQVLLLRSHKSRISATVAMLLTDGAIHLLAARPAPAGARGRPRSSIAFAASSSAVAVVASTASRATLDLSKSFSTRLTLDRTSYLGSG